MKKFIIMAVPCLFLCMACHNSTSREGSADTHVEDHSHEGHMHEGHSHEAAGEGGHTHFVQEISISEEQAAEAGIRTATIVPGDFKAAIRTSGIILPSGNGETVIAAGTSGILTWKNGTPAPGAKVREGEPIARISAEKMADGDAVQKAAIAYEAASREYARAQALIEDKVISEMEFYRIETEYKTALNAYMGVADGSGAGGLEVLSTSSGHLSSILRKEGEFVNAGDAIATVTSDSRLRLQADLPERYLASRDAVTDAWFRPSYSDSLYSISALSGRMTGMAASLEPASAWLPATFEFDNSSAGIVSGTYATVYLICDTRHDVISVPEQALTEEQGQFFVYVRIDEDCYGKVPVETGERNGEAVEIVSGLHGGEEVVVRGAYQVKLSSASVIPGHTHNH